MNSKLKAENFPFNFKYNILFPFLIVIMLSVLIYMSLSFLKLPQFDLFHYILIFLCLMEGFIFKNIRESI